MEKYSKAELSSDKIKLLSMNLATQVALKKGQEALEICISMVKDNVEKEMQILPEEEKEVEVAKDAKAQAEHAQNEIKANAP